MSENSFVNIGKGQVMAALGLPEESHYKAPVPEMTQSMVEWLMDHDAKLGGVQDSQDEVREYLAKFSSAAVADQQKLAERVGALESAPKPEPIVLPAPAPAAPALPQVQDNSEQVASLQRSHDETHSQIKCLIAGHDHLNGRVQALETAPVPKQHSHKPLWYVIITLTLSHIATAAFLALHH